MPRPRIVPQYAPFIVILSISVQGRNFKGPATIRSALS